MYDYDVYDAFELQPVHLCSFAQAAGRRLKNLSVGHVWQADEDITDVVMWIDTVLFAVPDEGVDKGGFPAAVRRAKKEPVFLTDGCGSDGVLGEVIVNLYDSVPDKDAKFWP